MNNLTVWGYTFLRYPIIKEWYESVNDHIQQVLDSKRCPFIKGASQKNLFWTEYWWSISKTIFTEFVTLFNNLAKERQKTEEWYAKIDESLQHMHILITTQWDIHNLFTELNHAYLNNRHKNIALWYATMAMSLNKKDNQTSKLWTGVNNESVTELFRTKDLMAMVRRLIPQDIVFINTPDDCNSFASLFPGIKDMLFKMKKWDDSKSGKEIMQIALQEKIDLASSLMNWSDPQQIYNLLYDSYFAKCNDTLWFVTYHDAIWFITQLINNNKLQTFIESQNDRFREYKKSL